MRSVLLCIILVVGLSSPAYCQQLKEITNSIGMKMVLILPGTFKMGSPVEEIGRNEDETQHLVTISNWYYLGAYEVTQEQFEKVMGSNPSRYKGAQKPVEKVTWDDAVSFCRKLSNLPEEIAAGREYRLPTEAEWEYACRATSTTAYFFGDTEDELAEYAWFGLGREDMTHPVGKKKPNRWGLYDIYGNVFEWCQDWNEPYPTGAATDPQGPSEGAIRVFRGGCWYFRGIQCRSAFRLRLEPGPSSRNIGFRVAMSLPAKQHESTSSK